MRVKAYMAAYYPRAGGLSELHQPLLPRAGAGRGGPWRALRARGGGLHPRAAALRRGGGPRARPGPRAARAAAFVLRRCSLLQTFARGRLRPVCAGGPVRLCLYAGAAHRRRPRAGTPVARRQALRPRAADGRAGLRRLGARLRLFPRRLGAGRAGGARGGGADAFRAPCILPARRREAPARKGAPAAPAQGPAASSPAPLRPARAGDDGLLLRLFPHALSRTSRSDGRAAGLGEPRLRAGGSALPARGRPRLPRAGARRARWPSPRWRSVRAGF